jgi:glycosyltransferase involved in cell wall biosynthesis
MTICVVMPVRDDAPFLSESLESVRAQTLRPSEVVLIDGGSTDGTQEVAARFPEVRLLAQRGPTLGDAYNEGIAATSAPLVAFHAGDDIWLPDKLERQAALLRETGSQACIGLAEFFLTEGEGPPPGFRTELLDGPQPARIPETLLCERALFERFGGWRPELSPSGDVDWFARIMDGGVAVPVLDAVVVRKRVHASSITHRTTEGVGGLLETARASIARKRVAR